MTPLGPILPPGPAAGSGEVVPDGAAPARSTLTGTLGDVLTESRSLATTTWLVLRRRGAVLVAISALGLLAVHWVTELAVLASRAGALTGILTFALVPGFAFAATAAMILVVGRRGDRSWSAGGLGALGSALLVFLLVYEQDGRLAEHRRRYLYGAFSDGFGLDGSSGLDRLPQNTSVTVIAVIVAAFVLRVGGAALLQRWTGSRRAAGLPESSAPVVLLRVAVTYAELVWIVLAVFALVSLWGGIGDWWSNRVVVHAVSGWWHGLGLPDVTGFVGGVAAVLGEIAGALVAGIVVPLVWLALAAMLYGSRFGEVGGVASHAARVTAAAQQRLTGAARAVRRRGRGEAGGPRPGGPDVARLERSWARLTEPEGRWDALGGAAGLLLAIGWVPTLVYCIVFTLASRVTYLVWWLAELLPLDGIWAWRIATPPIEALATLLAQVLAVAVATSGADRALRSAGLGTALRL